MSDLLIENVDSFDLMDPKLLNIAEPKLNEIVCIKEEINIDCNDQIIDGDGKVWHKEDFLRTWDSCSVKDEEIRDFKSINECPKNKNYSEVLSSKRPHSNNYKPKCYSCDFCDFSTPRGAVLRQHMKSVHLNLRDYKYEPSLKDTIEQELDDMITDEIARIKEENINIVDQIIDENEKVWPREDFLRTCGSHSIKSEARDEDSECNVKEPIDENGKFHSEKVCNSWLVKSTKCPERKNLNNSEVYSSKQTDLLPQNNYPPGKFISTNSPLKNHHCNFCDFNSRREGLLQKHIKSVHLNSRDYKCDLCSYSATRPDYIQNHIIAVHVKLKNNECHLCGHCSTTISHLRQHIKSVHLKVNNHKCHLCDYCSFKKHNLIKHINSVHLKLKNHKCEICDYTSSTMGEIQRHMNSVHLKVKTHKCYLCDHTTSEAGNLQKHIDSVHLKLKNHKCHLCKYCSSLKSHIQRHIKTVHLKMRNHKCPFCDYSSSLKAPVQRHIKLIHLKLKPHNEVIDFRKLGS